MNIGINIGIGNISGGGAISIAEQPFNSGTSPFDNFVSNLTSFSGNIGSSQEGYASCLITGGITALETYRCSFKLKVTGTTEMQARISSSLTGGTLYTFGTYSGTGIVHTINADVTGITNNPAYLLFNRGATRIAGDLVEVWDIKVIKL